MAKHKHIAHLSEIPLDKVGAPEGSAFAGLRQRVGAHIGAQKLGYSFFAVPPGKAAFPYHTHSGNEEMIYIIDGEGILRLGKEELAVSGGTVIACLPGAEYPHQLINTGNKELRYLVVSTMEFPDICEYPDSNKVGAYATAAVGGQVGLRALYVKDKNVNYYEGEDGREIERIKKSKGNL
ncbi:MAG TPA: cupin domain-containing protein [Methylomirabilota bacterium]|nr:cupin domain-containing protein [Methylomirabilota bacterium]